MMDEYEAQDPGNPYAPKPLKGRDSLHDLQLLRDLEMVNTRAQQELGPLPAGGLPAEPKRVPHLLRREVPALIALSQEEERMKLSQIAAVSALAAATLACEPKTQAVAAPPTIAVEAEKQSALHGEASPANAVGSTAPENASKPQLDTKYQEGMAYVDFRKHLLTDGWEPVVDPKCMENVVGAAYDKLCSKDPSLGSCGLCTKLPELSTCSSDGYCNMQFGKASDVLTVTAYGDMRDIDEPGKFGLDVSGWEFTRP